MDITTIKINYKNVKDAITLYNILKKADLDYYQLGNIIPKPNKTFLIKLTKKKYPYCGMRNTWFDVKMNDRFKLSLIKFKTATSYVD